MHYLYIIEVLCSVQLYWYQSKVTFFDCKIVAIIFNIAIKWQLTILNDVDIVDTEAENKC